MTLGWLPSFGRGDTVPLGWWTTGLLTMSGLKALILPSITLGLFQMTLIMRLVRAEMLEVLRTDYIQLRARPRPDRRAPSISATRSRTRWCRSSPSSGLQFGSVIAFAIITETVFQWPGMGLLFVQAVQNVDIPIMAAYLHAGGADLRRRSTSRSISSTRSSIRACASAIRRDRPEAAGDDVRTALKRRPPRLCPARTPRASRAFLDSDVWASFRRSKLTMVAARVDAAVLRGSPFSPA